MLLMDREWLEPDDFTTLTRSVAATQFKLPPEGLNLEEVERQLLTQALERSGGIRPRRPSCLASIAIKCATASKSSACRPPAGVDSRPLTRLPQ